MSKSSEFTFEVPKGMTVTIGVGGAGGGGGGAGGSAGAGGMGGAGTVFMGGAGGGRAGPVLTTSKDIQDLIRAGLMAVKEDIKTITKPELEEAIKELIQNKMPAIFTGLEVKVEGNLVNVEVRTHSHAERFVFESNILLEDVVKPPPPNPLDENFLKELKEI